MRKWNIHEMSIEYHCRILLGKSYYTSRKHLSAAITWPNEENQAATRASLLRCILCHNVTRENVSTFWHKSIACIIKVHVTRCGIQTSLKNNLFLFRKPSTAIMLQNALHDTLSVSSIYRFARISFPFKITFLNVFFLFNVLII